MSFAPGTAPPNTGGAADTRRDAAGVGTHGRRASSSSLVPVVNPLMKVKPEVIDVEEESKKKKEQHDKSVGEALAAAATSQSGAVKENKKK